MSDKAKSKVQEAIDARESSRGDVKGRPTSTRNPRGGRRSTKPKTEPAAMPAEKPEEPEA